jgi:hypothetical protein
VFAGLLGGWIGDQVGYDYAHRKLVDEWRQYEHDRDAGADRGRARESFVTVPPADAR